MTEICFENDLAVNHFHCFIFRYKLVAIKNAHNQNTSLLLFKKKDRKNFVLFCDRELDRFLDSPFEVLLAVNFIDFEVWEKNVKSSSRLSQSFKFRKISNIKESSSKRCIPRFFSIVSLQISLKIVDFIGENNMKPFFSVSCMVHSSFSI